ncbi:MAG: hypothetical protein J0L99_20835 [Chitinophagales bacterium]|nr:hypothetical protein [Chitinophagales bacterium]
MKTRLLPLLILLLLSAMQLKGQNDNIARIERDITGASGVPRIEKLVALAEACIQAGNYSRAQSAAEEAEELAARLRQPALRAQALNAEGKAMVGAGKRRSAGKFEQSLRLLRDNKVPNKKLALDNINQLRALAEKAGRNRELEILNQQAAQIDELLAGKTAAAAAPESEHENRGLSKIERQLKVIQSNLSAGQQEILESNKALQEELAAKQAELDRMSEEQIKTQMLVLQQKSLLDSVSYKSEKDALNAEITQLALQREQENNKFYIAAMLGLLALAGFAVFSFLRTRKHARTLADKNRIILEEQQRANGLLLNILPKSIADELISQGHTQARYFADAGVMFADFVGFTHIAGASQPQELVEDLHTAFSAFDQIITKHGLEKIKTIGDAYMCASGLPAAEQGNRLKAMILAATEIQQWLHDWNLRRSEQKQAQYIARIGIHRGPVVAGVVGSKKFAFDIWGDTVNTAARIEQAGEGGKINISEAVYEVVGKEFSCVSRGKIAIKNKTPQEMYFVTMNDER